MKQLLKIILLLLCVISLSCQSQNKDVIGDFENIDFETLKTSKSLTNLFKKVKSSIGLDNSKNIKYKISGSTEFLGNTCAFSFSINQLKNQYSMQIEASPLGFEVYENPNNALVKDFCNEIRTAGIMEASELRFNRYVQTHGWLFDDTQFKWHFKEETANEVEVLYRFKAHSGAAPIYGSLMISKKTWLPTKWVIHYPDKTETVQPKGKLQNAPYWFPKEVLTTLISGSSFMTKYDAYQSEANVILNETYTKLFQLRDFQFDAKAKTSQQLEFGKRGHLLIQASILGNKSQWFILDSGAGISVLDQNYKMSLGLKSKGAIDLVGVGGQTTSDIIEVGKLSIGSLNIANYPMTELDLSFLKPWFKVPVKGILGYGIFARAVVILDFLNGGISITDDYENSEKTVEWLPISVDRVPSIFGRFEGHKGWFMIDIGNPDNLTLHFDAVKSLDLLDDRQTRHFPLSAVGGTTQSQRGLGKRLDIGHLSFKNFEANFVTEKKGAYANRNYLGTIGLNFLRRYKVIFDYRNQRMAILE